MKHSKKWLLAGVVLLSASTAARADDAPVDKVVGSISITNDYLFRGMSQTNREPAIQPSIEYDDKSGWYAGAWGSNISWLSDASTAQAPISSSLEIDLYTGYRGNFTSALAYDVGLYTYYYPGSYPAGLTRPYTTEAYVSLAWKGISLGYNYGFTNLFGVPASKHSGYVDLKYNVEFTPGWTFNTHVGYQNVANNPGFSYYDWRVGVTRAFANGYSVALGYYDTNAKRSFYTNADGHYVGRATGILSLTKAF